MTKPQPQPQPPRLQRDRAVADQVRPSAPITCDDCARPWQPGAVFWRRASRPAWIYCRRCRSDQDTGQGDWEPIGEADMQQMAEASRAQAGEPADKPGSLYQCGAIGKAADRVLAEAGQQGGFNHISASQRRKHEARIQSERKQEDRSMPTGHYRRTPEMEAKRLETRRRNAALKAAALAQQGNGSATVTAPQEAASKPEPLKTASDLPVKLSQPIMRPSAEPSASSVLTAVATLRRLDAEARRAAIKLIG